MAAPRIVTPEAAGPGTARAGTAVGAAAFEALMAPLGPFEPAPRIAVAVSGGADSLALCLLAERWARARGGAVFGLTVDHRLRPESGAEAAQVRRWLAARAIPHRTLRWPGARRAGGGIQEEARAARLALLTAWCRRAGVLHLLLGHQREDQAETALQRLARGSGIDGLAAMAPVRLALEPAGGGVRLLRPLLSVPRDALPATLAQWDQPWIDDPTNRDRRHARPRLAAAIARLGPEGLSAARLARGAARAAGVAAVVANHWDSSGVGNRGAFRVVRRPTSVGRVMGGDSRRFVAGDRRHAGRRVLGTPAGLRGGNPGGRDRDDWRRGRHPTSVPSQA